MTLPRDSARSVLLRSWHEFLRSRGFDSAASLTFFSALSALPASLLALSGIALGLDRSQAERAVDRILSGAVPPADRRVIGDAVGALLANASVAVVVVAAALTLWSVAGYAAAFGRMVNNVYDVQEGRFFPALRARMLLVALPLVALGGVLVVVLIVTPDAVEEVLPTAGGWLVVWAAVRWLLGVAALVGIVGLLFRYAPNVRFTRIRWLGIGVLVSLTVWVALTAAFGVYVALTGAYGRLYGRLGIVLAALIWSYLSNLALVIGAQVDAEIMRLRQLAHGEDATETIHVPVKDTARQHRLADHRAHDLAVARRIRGRSS